MQIAGAFIKGDVRQVQLADIRRKKRGMAAAEAEIVVSEHLASNTSSVL